ncbi:MAG: FHA domain-containing protein [Phycisphaerae bacterium]|nr:FHA domain-containing protein [Phycisphaerae bacterium]
MKKIVFLLLFVLTVGISSAVTEPLAVTVIIDTSWSTEHTSIDDSRSLARQVFTGLRPGDYMEILTAESGKPKLHYALPIRANQQQELKELNPVLARISWSFLADAKIAPALEMACTRLAKQECTHAAVIIFSDGKLSDSDAQEVITLAAKYKAKGWQFWLTGTSATNRKLLVAAHRGLFNFSLISEASPIDWLKRPEPEKREETESPKPSLPAVQQVPMEAEMKSSMSVETSIDHKVQMERSTTIKPAILPLPKPVTEPNAVSAAPVIKEPAQPKIALPPVAKEPVKPKVAPAPPKPQKPRRSWSWLWWTLGVLALLAAVFGLLKAWGIRNARSWSAAVRERLRKTKSDKGILMARANGRTQRLGPVTRFHAAHIGRGAGNTIQITDAGVADKHARIYRKGADIMLQNLAGKPIKVNGIELKQKRTRLVLPSTIELGESAKVTLELQLPPRPAKEVDNEKSEEEKA